MATAHKKPVPLHTISALQMYQDMYFGEDVGKKIYLRNSYSGIPGEMQPHAPFSSAQTLYNFEDLISTRGYLILDAYSWRTIAGPNIRNYLSEHKPNAIVPGISDIYIWIMDGTESATENPENSQAKEN